MPISAIFHSIEAKQSNVSKYVKKILKKNETEVNCSAINVKSECKHLFLWIVEFYANYQCGVDSMQYFSLKF